MVIIETYRQNDKGITMIDQSMMHNLPITITELTIELKDFFNSVRNQLKGHERRQFMARVVSLMGPGGQIKAERELGWDRKTMIKGRREIGSGFTCVDNFSGRGRKLSLDHFPNLKEDITGIVNPIYARLIQPSALKIYIRQYQRMKCTAV